MGAAAMILVVLGWWYLVPHATQNANVAQLVVQKPKGTGTPQQGNKPAVNLTEQIPTGNNTGSVASLSSTKPMGGFLADEGKNAKHPAIKLFAPGFTPLRVMAVDPDIVSTANPIKRDSALLAVNSPVNKSLTFIEPTHTVVPVNITSSLPNLASNGKDTQQSRSENDESWFKRPRLTVTVLASADINGVNSLSNTNAGKNIGMLFSARFNKLSISTGAYYSSKPYNMPFSSYSPNSAYNFKYSPETVTADCRMLDIPLNIDYQVFAKNKNSISVGTGISSFIMLKESYQYNYAASHVYGLSSYNVDNPDKYLFSSVNFQANYRRQINSKIGLNIMPYVKVPLNDIGYSRVKLQTVGVAVGLNWNINSLTKPK